MDEIIAVPAFSDNYIWLLRYGDKAVLVDPGDAAPVVNALEAKGLELAGILLTHHHPDHVGGVEELLAWSGSDISVFGPAAESIPCVNRPLVGGEQAKIDEVGACFDVIDVGGHTLGHIAYFGEGAVFSGDTLFAAGCGRIFEGTAEQMWQSLSRLAALPPSTEVYCAHEYTLANLRFALAVEPDNQALQARCAEAQRLREEGKPTVPTTIADELAINPYLRVRQPQVIAAAEAFHGSALAGDAQVFAALRGWKDVF